MPLGASSGKQGDCERPINDSSQGQGGLLGPSLTHGKAGVDVPIGSVRQQLLLQIIDLGLGHAARGEHVAPRRLRTLGRFGRDVSPHQHRPRLAELQSPRGIGVFFSTTSTKPASRIHSARPAYDEGAPAHRASGVGHAAREAFSEYVPLKVPSGESSHGLLSRCTIQPLGQELTAGTCHHLSGVVEVYS